MKGHMTRESFPSTHWSSVYRIGDGTSEGQKDALGQLLLRYAPALKSRLCLRWKMSVDLADDMLQEFITEKVIRDQLISHARDFRGKFRQFLVKVLDNLVVDHIRRAHRTIRSSGKALLDIDGVPIADSSAADASDIFDIEWARQVIRETIQQMEAHCAERDQMKMWVVFVGRVLEPTLNGSKPVSYAELLRQVHFDSPTQAHVALVSAKRLFRRTLRAVVGEYTRDDVEIGEEIRDLIVTLSKRRA